MRRYGMVVIGLMVVFIVLFVLFEEVFHIPLLQDPSGVMTVGSIGVALVGVALLVVDVFLPVPASLVMIAHGALFGPVIGTLLSVIGGLGASLLGFGVGRRGGPLLEKLVSPEESARANDLLARWGWLAVIVTRPIPILAETTVIMAGASPLTWRTLSLATLAGVFPAALLFAITGATAVNLDNFLLTFGLVLVMAGVFWLIGRLFQARVTERVMAE
ncbi:MAG: VTT domain-containing protein [Anaerolineae bacterium]|nr:VTT domain-containing protein [Anaerolineae bacterium]